MVMKKPVAKASLAKKPAPKAMPAALKKQEKVEAKMGWAKA